MSGASLIEIAEILGHKTLAMVRRYSHFTQAHTQGASSAWPSNFSAMTTQRRSGTRSTIVWFPVSTLKQRKNCLGDNPSGRGSESRNWLIMQAGRSVCVGLVRSLLGRHAARAIASREHPNSTVSEQSLLYIQWCQ